MGTRGRISPATRERADEESRQPGRAGERNETYVIPETRRDASGDDRSARVVRLRQVPDLAVGRRHTDARAHSHALPRGDPGGVRLVGRGVAGHANPSRRFLEGLPEKHTARGTLLLLRQAGFASPARALSREHRGSSSSRSRGRQQLLQRGPDPPAKGRRRLRARADRAGGGTQLRIRTATPALLCA
jgi:hypothetical protein